MIFAQNRLYLVNRATDFLYGFSPLDALKLCLYEEQQERLLEEVLRQEESPPPDEATEVVKKGDMRVKRLNSVSIRPEPIQVKGSEAWLDKDMTKIKDLKVLEKTFDWTFSTPYKGTLGSFSQSAKTINEKEVQIELLKSLPEQG